MNTYRGRRRLLALAIAVLAASPHGMPARAATTTVIERGTQFVEKQVDIAPGDTVVWTFESGPSPGHTVTFDDGADLNRNCPPTLLLNDCQDAPGEIVQRRFTLPGTYSYFCKIHRGSGMAGVVVVSSAPSTSTTTAPVPTSSTLRTTTTTVKATSSSTTATTRPLATSSTLAPISTTTTTTSEPTSVLQPGEPPTFTDDTSSAANRTGGSDGRNDSGAVALIVGLLLAVSAGGGYLLWRLRPGRP
jgi:plastocyanin